MRQVDILASPAPRPDELVEPGQRCAFMLTARHEGPEVVQSREPEISRPRANAGVAVGQYEMNCPSIAVVIEVQQDTGHEDTFPSR